LQTNDKIISNLGLHQFKPIILYFISKRFISLISAIHRQTALDSRDVYWYVVQNEIEKCNLVDEIQLKTIFKMYFR